MIRKFGLIAVFMFFIGCIYASMPVYDLVKRLLPSGSEKNFVFEQSKKESSVDFFEISSKGSKIHIVGNTPVSIASGLNWYLKYYCNCSFSFCESNNVLPKKLPLPKEKVRMETPLKCNFYMNYCTFSYTASFWDWERWEREIDLMALNGINTPMAMVGVEAVWRNTLREFDYTDEEIKDFLCGPAFFGWFLMANLEKHGGPLPDEWFERQIILQKKIVARMRDYGMHPVFQGFFGMVPGNFHLKYPESEISNQGNWSGFKRPPVLLSTDPLFSEIAEVWYDEYEKLYGKTDCFGGDLFHEGGVTEGIDVAEVASGVQECMLEYNPDARWFIQAWGNNPKPELLSGLDREHTVIVDLCAEYWTRWKDRKGFDGFPWIWSHITNYGGNIGLHGRLDAIARGVIDGRKDPAASKSMLGIGSTPEGIEVNPVVFDLSNEMRWRKDTVDMDEWIRRYADRRYGKENGNIRKAWNIFYHTAYGTYKGHRRPSESVFCAKPSLKGKRITASAWSQCRIFYNPEEFAKGVKLFLAESGKFKDIRTYEYDAVDFVRQYLADLGRDAYIKFVDAYKDGDKETFRRESERFLSLILDQDRLLSSTSWFNVCSWIDMARSASQVEDIKNQYEYNARLLVGTWSDRNTSLRDYGHKEWGGMLRDYYYPRWNTYVSYLQDKLEGKDVKEPDFYPGEKKWVESHNEYKVETTDVVKLAKSLFEKYNR